MKAPGNAQGSFGIPPAVEEAAQRARATSSANVKKASEPPPQVEDVAPPPPPEAKPDDAVAEASNPNKVLETLGITFSEELLQQLIFKGFVEHTVDIVKGALTAKFKTLTVEEHDMVDEMLAEETEEVKMTNSGFENRRSLLVLGFGVVELAGKPVTKPVLEKGAKTVDKRATARKRREVLQAMAPGIVTLMIQKHGAMTLAFNMIASEPGEHIKNS